MKIEITKEQLKKLILIPECQKMEIEIGDGEMELKNFPEREILEYVADNLRDGILDEIGERELIDYISESVGLDDVLRNMDKDEIAEWLNESSEISGYKVIKTESLRETELVESFISKMGRS